MNDPAPCHDGVCVTCSDTAVEVLVTALLGDWLALVDTGDGSAEVSVAFIDAAVGDTILVHAGEALARVGTPRSRESGQQSGSRQPRGKWPE